MLCPAPKDRLAPGQTERGRILPRCWVRHVKSCARRLILGCVWLLGLEPVPTSKGRGPPCSGPRSGSTPELLLRRRGSARPAPASAPTLSEPRSQPSASSVSPRSPSPAAGLGDRVPWELRAGGGKPRALGAAAGSGFGRIWWGCPASAVAPLGTEALPRAASRFSGWAGRSYRPALIAGSVDKDETQQPPRWFCSRELGGLWGPKLGAESRTPKRGGNGRTGRCGPGGSRSPCGGRV